MKYFVAHLLRGEAYEYHRSLTRALAERFHTVPLHERVDPHITVKIPFSADEYEIAEVEAVLADFADAYTPEPYVIEGFGRFDRRTVYLDVVKSRGAALLVRECVGALNELPWIQKVPHEGMKLHSSVARFLTPRQFRRVWRHLSEERPHFRAAVDSIALLKKEAGGAWEVHREFCLRPSYAHASLTRASILAV